MCDSLLDPIPLGVYRKSNKNFNAHNRAQLKEIQAKNRAQEANATLKQFDQPFVMNKFKHVDSKVKQFMQPGADSPENDAKQEARHDFLKSKKKSTQLVNTAVKTDEKSYEKKHVSSKPAMPTLDELRARKVALELSAPTDTPNFITSNALKAIHNDPSLKKKATAPAKLKQSLGTAAPPVQGHANGKVPAYLKDIKAELEHKKKWEQAQVDEYANRPPIGYTRLSEEDRLETLQSLKQRRNELEGEMNKLPMLRDNFTLQKREKDIRKTLDEVDDAIRVFSRKEVLIAEDF